MIIRFCLVLLVSVSLLVFSPEYGQALSETQLLEKIAERSKQINELDNEIAVHEDFQQAYDSQVQKINDAASDLETLKNELETVQTNNLIKKILQLAFATYDTIDSTVNLLNGVVKNFTTVGARFATGLAGFELLGGEVKKLMGGDMSPRNMKFSDLSDELAEHSIEIEKISYYLKMPLGDIITQVELEENKILGKDGATLRKNIMVRAQIDKALAKIPDILDAVASTHSSVGVELTYARSLRESYIAEQLDFKRMLDEAVADREAQQAAAAAEAEADKQKEAAPAPDYTPPMPENGESADDYIHRKYLEMEAYLHGLLSAIHSDMQEKHSMLSSLLAQVEEDIRISKLESEYTISLFQDYVPQAADFQSLYAVALHMDSLLWTKQQVETSKAIFEGYKTTQLVALRNLAEEINNHAADAGNFDTTAAQAPDVDGSVVKPPLSYGYYESFADWAKPQEFIEIEELGVAIESHLQKVEIALEEVQEGIDLVSAAYIDILGAHKTLMSQEETVLVNLSSAVDSIAVILTTLENFCVGKEYTQDMLTNEYRIWGVANFSTFFLETAFNDAMADRIANYNDPHAALELFNDFNTFSGGYNLNGETYTEAYYTMRLATSQMTAVYENTAWDIMLADGVSGSGLSSQENEQNMLDTISEINGYLRMAGDLRTNGIPDLPEEEDLVLLELYQLRVNLDTILSGWTIEKLSSEVTEEYNQLIADLNGWKSAEDNALVRFQYDWVVPKLITMMDDQRLEYTNFTSPPRFTLYPEEGFVSPGGTYTLRVNTEGAASYKWYEYDYSESTSELSGQTGKSFIAPYLSYPTRYYCIAKNEFGESQSGTVEVAPRISPQLYEEPWDVDLLKGQDAVLSAGLYFPGLQEESAARIRWYVSENEREDSAYIRISGETNQILDLYSVQHTRWYYMLAENDFGSTTTRKVRVRVTNGMEEGNTGTLDLNGDNFIDLQDLILGLQVISGQSAQVSPVGPENKIDMGKVLSIVQLLQ